MIADSSGCDGANPLASMSAAFEAACQSSFDAMIAWSEERTSCNIGFGSGLAIPLRAERWAAGADHDGLRPLPWITKPRSSRRSP
jgi:hypothetical protein